MLTVLSEGTIKVLINSFEPFWLKQCPNSFRHTIPLFFGIIRILSASVQRNSYRYLKHWHFWNSPSVFLRRIGRTGRKGRTGTAYTLFTNGNAPKAKDLVDVLAEAKQVINPKLQELSMCGSFGGRSRGPRYGGGGGKNLLHTEFPFSKNKTVRTKCSRTLKKY